MAKLQKVSVFFTPDELSAGSAERKTVVVIDVLRATSCMVEALANGATAILPTESIEDATKLRDTLDRDRILLCGERGGLPIEGFDLGNSPAEFTPDVVTGKQLIMTTTNGTRAFLAAARANRTLAGAFLNLGAVAQDVAEDAEVAVLCAGKEGRFSLDDAVCAGHLVRRLLDSADESVLIDDAAAAAVRLAKDYKKGTDAFALAAAGRALIRVGLESDLAVCAAADRHKVVPAMVDRAITLPSE